MRSRPSVDGLRWLPGGLAVLRDETQPDSHILAAQLAEQPEVESAEPNYLAHIPVSRSRAIRTVSFRRLFGTPNDPDFGNYQWNFQLIDMPHAWDINPGGSSSLIVATIDTGVTTVKQSFTFPLFTGSKIENVSLPFDVSPDLPASRLVSPHDFVFMPGGGPVLDFDGHGTHVSSTIAEATNNGLLGAGMAYNVRLMPVKVCVGYWELMIANAQAGQTGFLPEDSGDCPFDAIIQGVRYAADNGAKVINISLGGEDPSNEMRNAIAYAVQQGAFVAMAMGNNYDLGNPIEYPAFYAASIDGAMSAAAVTQVLEPRLLLVEWCVLRDRRARRRCERPERARLRARLADHAVVYRSGSEDPGAALRPVRPHRLSRHLDGLAARRRAGGARDVAGRHESGGRRGVDQTDGQGSGPAGS